MKNRKIKLQADLILPCTPEILATLDLIETTASDIKVVDYTYSLISEDYTRFYYIDNPHLSFKLDFYKEQSPEDEYIYETLKVAEAARDDYDKQNQPIAAE